MSLIKAVFELLEENEYYNESEAIETVKGKYQLCETTKQRAKQLKRLKKWRKKK